MLFAALAARHAFQLGAPMMNARRRRSCRARRPRSLRCRPARSRRSSARRRSNGIVGVYLFHELSTGVLLALIAAYAATTASTFGDATRSAGSAADKVYSKTLELNEQYDLLPKAKSAADAGDDGRRQHRPQLRCARARGGPLRIQRISARALRARLAEPPPRSLRRRSGSRGKIDDQLKISASAIDKATGSFNDFKGSVTDKVTELKLDEELRLDGQPPVYLASQHTHIAVSRMSSRRNRRKSDVPGLSATASPRRQPTRHLGPLRSRARAASNCSDGVQATRVVGRIARERQRTNCGLGPQLRRKQPPTPSNRCKRTARPLQWRLGAVVGPNYV